MGAVVALLVPGCSAGSSGSSEVSRVRLYSSAAELAEDSAAVVIGRVESQRVAADIPPDDLAFTISTVRVQRVVRGSAAGVERSVQVRQVGSSDQDPPSPLLESGRRYLLFLTPSGLDGALADQYYVTGANAGIYESGGSSDATEDKAEFARQSHQPGENLPERLTPADLQPAR